MKNSLYQAALVVYALAMCVLGIINLAPVFTENIWSPATLHVLHALVIGFFILASGMLGVDFYNMFRWYGLLGMSQRKHEDPVQRHILRYAEDLYQHQGYFNQGSFCALNIALQFSVEEKDPLVEDAMLALVEAGKLLPHRSDKGTVYVLPAARQMELITKHDLSCKWEERGGRYHPNNVIIGEIQRVKSAVAATQRQESHS